MQRGGIILIDFYFDYTKIIIMRFTDQSIENAISGAKDEMSGIAERVAHDLKIQNDKDWFIVGGAVRDAVIDKLVGQKNKSKDIDIILSENLDLVNNSNIVWKKENSFGGIKVQTLSVSEIDIFNQKMFEPAYFIANNFDFNCNSLYYSCRDKQIHVSAFFYDFISRKTIEMLNCHYAKNQVYGIYPDYAIVARALKFQVLFYERYNMNVKLSDNIWYMLMSMDKSAEYDMFQYIKQKVKDNNTVMQIMKKYNMYKQQ